MPREFLPIAGDGSGNAICLSLKGKQTKAQYTFGTTIRSSPLLHMRMSYLIAETFEGFLDSIYFEDLGEEVAKSLGKTFQ